MFYYGAAYYPEHKTAEELAHDLKLIKESGINTIRMGEFAWCRFEPSEGEYHFEWLDPVVEELGKAGVRTIICTPTACPPAWMVEKHPDMMYTDGRGVVRPFGGRRHYCYNNEAFRAHSERIAEEIGKHYGRNPYVAGFQIDNEPAQEVTGRCTCAVCKGKFRAWLEKKYQTIEELNKRTGGIFWSQEYTSFSQINPPVNSIEVGAMQSINAFYENPSIRLDFERFASDSQIEYQDIQTRALKKYTDYPITTNATGLATNSIDYYKSTKELSCYAFDFYPGLRDAAVDSFPYAFARGVKDNTPFWVLEFMSGGGHRLSGSGRVQPNPGALKQAVLQSFAHGAEMMMHFQFRTFPIGAEQLNYAIVDMDGVPRRRYYEMKDTAALLKKLEPAFEAKFVNETAVLVDYDCHWALRIKPANDPKFNYLDYCGFLYNALSQQGYNADVKSFDADLSAYKAVFVPAAFLLPVKYREKLKEYVKNGGHVVMTFLSSVKNEDNIGYTETLPAGLTDLFGAEVDEVEPIFDTNHLAVELKADGRAITVPDNMWSELLSGSAEMVGTYTEDYKAGTGVISKNAYGRGTAWYLGTDTGKEGAAFLIREIAKTAGLTKNAVCPKEKVEVVRRSLDGRELYFVFNFTAKDTEVLLEKKMKDYVTGETAEGSIAIARNGFAVLIEE